MALTNNPIGRILGVTTGESTQTAIQAKKDDDPFKKHLPMVAYNTSFVGGLDKVSVFNAQPSNNEVT